jgi:uridine kinase
MNTYENFEGGEIYENFQEGIARVSQQCQIWEREHSDQHDLVLVAGPAGSGKSTFAEMIATDDTLVLALDRYYLGAERQKEEQGTVNFSIPEALDWERLNEDLEKLLISKSCEPVMVPSYSMRESARVGEEEVLSKPRIIVEGVYALRLERETPFKIYIEVSDELLLNRRLKRDMIERGISEGTIISRFNEKALPALNEFVKPQRKSAAFIIENNSEKSA